jgi:two-component system sensor histidine kinase VicK
MGGAYVGTRLVFSNFIERLQNQLTGAARVANQVIGDQEARRLTIIRQIVATQGIEQAIEEAATNNQYDRLNDTISAIAFNNADIDSIVILDGAANELLRLDRIPGSANFGFVPVQLGLGTSYGDWGPVQEVLSGQRNISSIHVEEENGAEDLIYTIGIIRSGGQDGGVILVGQYLDNVLRELGRKSSSNVTLYNTAGVARHTTFPQTGAAQVLTTTPETVEEIINQQTTDYFPRVSFLGSEYMLTFAPFQLSGGTIGIYSVGLSTDFVLITGGPATRNLVTGVIFIAITVLLLIAILVTRQIIKPLSRLVRASVEIASGNLNQETGIQSNDEIGRLASTFDQMTVQLRRRTDELEELVKFQTAILSSIADGVLVQDPDGKIAQINPAAEKILAQLSRAFPEHSPEDYMSIAEIILTHLAETAPGEPTQRNTPIRETIDTHSPSTEANEEPPRNFDIGSRSISTRAAPVIADTDERLGSVVVVRDRTLEVASDKLKNKLIESLSHELLTPLVPLKMNLQLFQMTVADQLGEQQRNIIDTIDYHANQLNELITSLLDFAQIESEGQSAIEFQEFDLNDLVEEVCEFNQARMNADASMAKMGLTFNIHLEQPSSPVNADPGRMKRTLNALIENAIKYNREKGKVDVSLKHVDGSVQIDVVDTGRGVEKSTQPYLMKQAFIRQVQETDLERGNGLGLYLAGKVIEAHGGGIWFESEENEGSTFSLTIPLLADNEPEMEETDKVEPSYS